MERCIEVYRDLAQAALLQCTLRLSDGAGGCEHMVGAQLQAPQSWAACQGIKGKPALQGVRVRAQVQGVQVV